MTFRYDIALLRLSADATLNNYVQLGALPPSGQVLPHNNPCYITGWGRTQSESDIVTQFLDNLDIKGWEDFMLLSWASSQLYDFSRCP